MCYLIDTQYDDDTVRPTTVLEYINNELLMDQMDFSNRLYKRTFEIAKRFIDPYYRDLASFNSQLEKDTREFISQEMVQTDDQEPLELDSHSLIVAQENKEKSIQAKANATAMKKLMDFSSSYLMKLLCSIDDDQVRQLACELATDNLPQLSKIHTKYTVIVEERDRLLSIVPERLYNWKNALLIIKINEVKAQIASAAADQLPQLLEHLQELYSVRHQLAAIIGDRVVNPN